MFYDGFFDINGDGKMDGFEEFMEYKAFRDFEESLEPDGFEPELDEDLDFLEEEADEDSLDDDPEDDEYEADEYDYDSDESGFAALGKLSEALSKLGLEIEASLEYGDGEEDTREETETEKTVEYKPSPEWKNRSEKKKEEILLSSFDVLKDDVLLNHDSLHQIFRQLETTNPRLMIEMWEYLLEENWDAVVRDTELYNSVGFYLTSEMMMTLTEEEAITWVEDRIIESPRISEAVFKYSPNLPPWTTSLWATQVKRKRFEYADKVFRLMQANRKNNFNNIGTLNDCWSGIFENCIDQFLLSDQMYWGKSVSFDRECKDPEIYEYLSRCAEEVTDSKERARINVLLVKLL